jgi:hypothetical protein
MRMTGSMMTDEEYQTKRAKLQEALAFKNELEDEMVRRGDAFVLHAFYYHSPVEWPFFSLEDALERASDDCAPKLIVGPDGTEYDPYTGEVTA